MTTPEQPIRVNPVPVAYQLAKQGVSARQGLVAAREAGVAIRDATWFKLYADAKANLSLQIFEPTLLLDAKPGFEHIGELRTKAATGYLQYVQVYTRDRDTGLLGTKPFAVRTQELGTRESVIKRALAAYGAQATPSGNYAGEQIVGAAYTGTVQLFPALPGEDL